MEESYRVHLSGDIEMVGWEWVEGKSIEIDDEGVVTFSTISNSKCRELINDCLKVKK